MALIDNPENYILLMFRKEISEGRGKFCKVFPKGVSSSAIDLNGGELIYGIYKGKFIFTPVALIVKENEIYCRVPWAEIKSCSTLHGDGDRKSIIELNNGVSIPIEMSELATGWQGRISQLYHKMIEHLGCRAYFGLPFLDVQTFFSQITTEDNFAPNLYPRPSKKEIENAFDTLVARSDVIQALLPIKEYEGGEPVSDSLLIIGTSEMEVYKSFGASIGLFEISAANENEYNQLPEVYWTHKIWKISWR